MAGQNNPPRGDQREPLFNVPSVESTRHPPVVVLVGRYVLCAGLLITDQSLPDALADLIERFPDEERIRNLTTYGAYYSVGSRPATAGCAVFGSSVSVVLDVMVLRGLIPRLPSEWIEWDGSRWGKKISAPLVTRNSAPPPVQNEAQGLPVEPRPVVAWLMDTGDDASWVEIGSDMPAPDERATPRALVLRD